jgi:hypothetical protein
VASVPRVWLDVRCVHIQAAREPVQHEVPPVEEEGTLVHHASSSVGSNTAHARIRTRAGW